MPVRTLAVAGKRIDAVAAPNTEPELSYIVINIYFSEGILAHYSLNSQYYGTYRLLVLLLPLLSYSGFKTNMFLGENRLILVY